MRIASSRRRATLRRAARVVNVSVAVLALAAATGPAMAMGFLTPVDGVPPAQVTIVTSDGQVLEGRVSSSFQGLHGLNRVTLKDQAGTKHKLQAADIRRLTVPVDGWVRNEMMENATTTLEKVIGTDYEQIFEVRELVYDSLTMPGRDKPVLLQRVNPGFDAAIQVYNLPNAKEGTTRVGDKAFFGDEPKAFLVVKNGAAPIKVKKGDYRDQFESLFGDCPDLLAKTPRRDRDFDDFAEHVYAYQTSCGGAP